MPGMLSRIMFAGAGRRRFSITAARVKITSPEIYYDFIAVRARAREQ